MIQLIVNADDFGLTKRVIEGIVDGLSFTGFLNTRRIPDVLGRLLPDTSELVGCPGYAKPPGWQEPGRMALP